MNLNAKIYLITILAIFGLLMFGNTIMAQNPIPSIPEIGGRTGSVSGLVAIFTDIVKWIYTIFFIVAVMFVIFAAFTYLTAGGDAEKVGNAKSQIIYAAVAIIVALLAVSLQAIIRNFLISGQ
ncbi:MAG: hypothetical protein AAB366_03040 [Patescibacteria group bacterium]